MFKKIPGNTDYRINLNQEIIDLFGNKINFKVVKGEIEISLFGEIKKVQLKWLSLLAHYEIGHINDLKKHLDKIRFLPTSNKSLSIACGYLMYFTEPIYFKENFRYIPCYPRYAVDITGNVVDTTFNYVIPVISDRSVYVDVYIRNPIRNGNRDTKLHRLIALAWLPNNDFINRPFINHIDGNKKNNKLSNLEWCSYSENSKHAIDLKLNDCCLPMKTRDIVTGEVVIYSSVIELSRKLGTTTNSSDVYLTKLPGYLVKKRYEVKLASDDGPWYYENETVMACSGHKSYFSIKVIDKTTGECKTFLTVKNFFKTYKLYPKSCKLEDGINIFKEKYKNMDVSYTRNALKGPYLVLDIITQEATIFNSMKEAALYIGRTPTEIQCDLFRRRKFIYNKKWLIQIGLEKTDLNEYKEKPIPVLKVSIRSAIDNKETIVKSIKKTAKLLNVTSKSIAKYLNTGKIFKGYYFRTLE